MPVDFIQDTSVQNSILYAYTTGYNNQPINSNILFNILTPYDRITDRNTAITTALSVKQDILTFTSPLNITGTTVTLNLTSSQIPSLDVSKITTGTFGTSFIPSLNVSKITAGTFGTSFIPSLDASKITTGTFATSFIPSLDASKITTGVLNTSLIPSFSNYVTTTSLNALNYINSNTVANIYLSSNVFSNTLLSYTTTSALNALNYINSNTVANLYISSNNIQNILLPYDKTIDRINDVTALSNMLYEIYDKYSLQENQYPAKAFDYESSNETDTTFLGKSVKMDTFGLSNAVYGNGDYIVYSSSTYNIGYKKNLFNYNTVESPAGYIPCWGLNNYTAGTYNKSNFILSDYTGEWVILKLPLPIILTKFVFISRSGFSLRAPGLWRVYGSMDGITFYNIVQGNNDVTKLTTAAYPGDIYTKILSTTFDIPYTYIGFTFKAIAGNDTILNFTEIRLFGRGFLRPSEKYVSSNMFYSNLSVYDKIIDRDNSIISLSNIYVSSNMITNYATNSALNTKQDALNISTNILGIGSNISLIDYSKIYNPPNLSIYATTTELGSYSTTTQMNSAITTALTPYLTSATATSTYATITNLNTKQNTLIASTTLLGIGSNITAINYANISNPPALNFLPLTGGTITGQLTQTGTNPAFFFGGGSGAAMGQASGTGAFSTSAAIGDAILRSQTGKQLILQSGANAGAIIINSANNVSITNTLNATTLQQGGVGVSTLITNALSSYLPLTGGTISSTLDVRGGIISQSLSVVDSTSYTNQFQLVISPPTTTTSATIQTIKQGTGYNQNLNLQPSGGTITLTGTTTCSSTLTVGGVLRISEATGTAAGANSGSIILDHDNTNGVSSIVFRSKINRGSDFGYIQYNDNLGGVGESGKLIIGTQNDADDDIILMPSGKVGIGTALPQSLLDVNGSIACSGMTFTDASYINYPNSLYFKNTVANKTISMTAGNLNVPESINVAGYINLTSAVSSYLSFADKWKIGIATVSGVANSLVFNHIDTGINSYWYFNGTQTNTASEISDERVKKQIGNIENPLNKFMLLKPKEYYLCDDKDYNKKFGIIAQDIEIDFPELIYTDTEYIANIYSYATYNNFIITFDKDITDLININDELKIVLDNNDKNNLEICIDDTPYSNRYKRKYCKVVEIINNYSFKIDIELQEENVFVFGKKTKDFKKLDYQSLYCLNIAATQELYNIIKELKARIEILENR